MTIYVNKTQYQRQIVFEDNSVVFLKRGQKVESAKKVKRMDTGVHVKELPKKQPTRKKSDELTPISED